MSPCAIDEALLEMEQSRHHVWVQVAARTWQRLHSDDTYGEDNALDWLTSLGLPSKTIQALLVMPGLHGQSLQSSFNSSLRFLDRDTFRFLLSDVLGVRQEEIRPVLAKKEAADLRKLYVSDSQEGKRQSSILEAL